MPEERPTEAVAKLFDTFEITPLPAAPSDPIAFPGYPDQLARLRSSGALESVVNGVGAIGEHRVVASVFDFAFLGGSLGVAAGAAIEDAMRTAVRMSLPYLAVTASGGARMQEGMAALAQMPRTIAASEAVAAAGLLRIGLIRGPTTGGVYASFLSQCDIVAASPGVTVGFAGPRVVETVTGVAPPPDSHTSEAALDAGLIDAVLDPRAQKEWLRTLLATTARGATATLWKRDSPLNVDDNDAVARNPRTGGRRLRGRPQPHPAEPPRPGGQPAGEGAWREFAVARHPHRPGPRRYLDAVCPGFVELRGDRVGREDPAVIAGLARIGDQPVAVAAIDRARPTAAGYRKACRVIELAGRLGIPLLTLVDTPGADPSPQSEYQGLARAISETFRSMLSVEVPVVCLVTGEGGSGGALALSCGDRVGMLEHSVFSVIAPEAAATILHRDASRVGEVAEALKPTAHDVLALGLIDEVVPEPEGGAHRDPAEAASTVEEWIRAALATRADRTKRAARFSEGR